MTLKRTERGRNYRGAIENCRQKITRALSLRFVLFAKLHCPGAVKFKHCFKIFNGSPHLLELLKQLFECHRIQLYK